MLSDISQIDDKTTVLLYWTNIIWINYLLFTSHLYLHDKHVYLITLLFFIFIPWIIIITIPKIKTTKLKIIPLVLYIISPLGSYAAFLLKITRDKITEITTIIIVTWTWWINNIITFTLGTLNLFFLLWFFIFFV